MADELGDLFEFWSPNAVLEYIKTVSAGYEALHADAMHSSAFDAPNMKAWLLLYNNFRKFADGTGYFSALSLSPLRTAEEYARQLIYWRNLFTQRSGRPATGATVNIPAAQQEASMNKLVLIGGLALAAYLAVNTFQLMPRRVVHG